MKLGKLQALSELRDIAKDESISTTERVRQCINYADIYFCITGDDSLQHPSLIEARTAMIDRIPKAMAAAKKAQENRAKGQEMMEL